MRESMFSKILKQIAVSNGITVEEVREQMHIAMLSALKNPDPMVQEMWRSIPKEGEQLTLEEFMDYLIGKNLLHA